MTTSIPGENAVLQGINEALKKSEARLRLQMERMPIACIVWSPEFRVLSWNPAAEQMFGFTAQEALGRHAYDLIVPKPVQAQVDVVWGRLREGDFAAHSENENVTKDGRTLLCSWTNTPLREESGEVIGVLSMTQDITERRRAEEALQRARDELEIRVRQRTEELARSNAELQQFAYVASHDLQEPLRAIGGFARLLQRRYRGKLDAEADEFLNLQIQSAQRMQDLIHGLLAYSRVGTQSRPFETVDCNAALGEAVWNLQVVIEQAAAEVTCQPLPTLAADHSQLVQLFQNLISNAVKFHGPQPPRVAVSARQDGPTWTFAVRDNGIGIEAKYADRVFGIFQRLHTHEEYPGSGIGLAICKRIVARHGGRIWFESQPGEGTTFYFTLEGERR